MKEKIIAFLKSLNKKNITSTVLSIIPLINQVLTLSGKGVLPIDNAVVEATISIIFTVATNAYLAWTNFNTSTGAQKVQAVLDGVKMGLITIEEVEQFVEDHIEETE